MEGIKQFIEQHLIDLYNERDRVNELMKEEEIGGNKYALRIWLMHVCKAIEKYKSYKSVFNQ